MTSLARRRVRYSWWTPAQIGTTDIISIITIETHVDSCVSDVLLLCNHCSKWTWFVEGIMAFDNKLRSTHCRKFHYLKLCSTLLELLNLFRSVEIPGVLEIPAPPPLVPFLNSIEV